MNGLYKGADVITGTITWSIILLVLGGAALLAFAFAGGVFACDLQFSHWLNARSQFWGDLYLWGPKILVLLLFILPPIIFTKRS